MKIKLRGHHLLCLQGFQGYGYSEEFVENMTKINDLRKVDSTIIRLTDSPDDICKACPNLKNNLCKDKKTNENIVSMDNEVLSKLNNEEYNSIELFNEINKIFNNKESISKICKDCGWYNECLFMERFK